MGQGKDPSPGMPPFPSGGGGESSAAPAGAAETAAPDTFAARIAISNEKPEKMYGHEGLILSLVGYVGIWTFYKRNACSPTAVFANVFDTRSKISLLHS